MHKKITLKRLINTENFMSVVFRRIREDLATIQLNPPKTIINPLKTSSRAFIEGKFLVKHKKIVIGRSKSC